MEGTRSAVTAAALIIACSEYEDGGLRQLRAPAADAERLAEVLAEPAIGGFEVTTQLNQPSHVLNLAIEDFFADRGPDDLLLLYVSSHGVEDDDGRLYFAAANTRLRQLGATAVAAAFVNEQMTKSRSRRIVLLLDCDYSGTSPQGALARGGKRMAIKEQFGGSGRAVLTASSAMEYAFEGDELADARDLTPSVFTSALVEGLETGAADLDLDGRISVDELYDYVSDRVRDQTPNQTPGRWITGVQGKLYIARVRPRELPDELRRALQSSSPDRRLGAVSELRRLLEPGQGVHSAAAREALERLTEDDSRRVSASATAALTATEASAAAAAVEPVETPAPTMNEPAPAGPAAPPARVSRGRRWPRIPLPWPRRRRQRTRPPPQPWTPAPLEDRPEPTDGRARSSVAVRDVESAEHQGFCASCGNALDADRRFCSRCGAPTGKSDAAPAPAEAEEPPMAPILSPDERAAFTVAYPSPVSPTVWYSLHVYLHRPRLQAVVDKQITNQFRRLGLRRSTSTAEALVPLPNGTAVQVKPRVDGLAFNPLVQEVVWWEDLHEVLFRFRALNTTTATLFGSVDIYAGPLPIAQVPVAVSVGGVGQPEQSELVEEGAEVFSRIFASYSHQDSDIVSACAEAYRALGIEMLIDRDSLRSGQDWRDVLQQLIEDSDTFQLFWSTASSVSPHVAEEWRHALQLRGRKGGQFIRPLRWENPWPTAPDELSNLHFALLDLRELSRVAGRSLGPGPADTSQL
jgi:Caspase domain/TIR domain